EAPTLFRRNKLAPRHGFAVGASRQPAPVHRFRADAHAIVEALQGQVFAATPMAQFYEWTKLLRPVSRYTTADSQNPQALLLQQRLGVIFEVFEGIEA